MIGAKFLHYEIRSLLGAGGMGEVYEATDSKLGRNVAIKCLPAEFTHDAERVARLQREARLLASLSHPNVAAVYGLEENAGRHFLVMELVAGDTLDQRIRRGPISVNEALEIAKQITEGLEAAHEKGIVHRDLKPANIKLTPDGVVKLLDFGLAKAMEDLGANRSESPTLSLAMTGAGLILGTAAYMSPEQARGSEADKRSDIWAFGVVLYEMLTGKRLFDEPTTSDTLAAVLKGDLKLDDLPDSFPLKELLGRCLERDRRRRLRDIGEARIALENLSNRERVAVRTPLAAQDTQLLWKRALPWALASVLAVAAAVTAWVLWPQTAPKVSAMRLNVDLGIDEGLHMDVGAAAVVSPDGNLLAFTTGAAKTPALWVRKLDELNASALAGTEGALTPFFSPDGKWIAFFADQKLKKVPVSGGAVATLLDGLPQARGGTWTEDGFIIFTPNSAAPLLRISEEGGTTENLTQLDAAAGELTHRWPQILPGGKAVLFTSSTNLMNFEEGSILVQRIPNGEKKVVQRSGFFARYMPSGHLVYIQGATLFSAPFDLERLEITASPVRILEGVTAQPRSGGAQFSFSNNGVMVYVPGKSLTRADVQLTQWMDQQGESQTIWTLPAQHSEIRLSPDGRRLASVISTTSSSLNTGVDIWFSEPDRDVPSRLTSEPAEDVSPVWVGNDRIAFASRRDAKTMHNIYWQRIDGTGQAQRLTNGSGDQRPSSWNSKAKALAFIESGNVMILPMEGDESSGWKPGKAVPFLDSQFEERSAEFSPDGQWLAYESNESGKGEVYVRPFPGPGPRTLVSSAGGVYPTWLTSGHALLYFNPDENQFMVSTVTVKDGSLIAGKPVAWSKRPFTNHAPLRPLIGRFFDLHANGKKVAVLTLPSTQIQEKQRTVSFFFGFFDELRRLSPVQR